MTEQTRRIGRYTLIRKLGEGGMGIVYLAQDPEFRLVALKVLRPELAGREDFRRRFTREAEAARQVARFCTAPVLDAGIDGETAFLVTEYVEGPDLSTMIERQGPMHGANLEALAVGVATALAAIHQAGVVHSDLKPSNILLSAVGPRVIDFGIARLADPEATQSVTVAGTPAYMAPEQANGGLLTPASDVFAWGGVVTYAGTGRPPFGTGEMPEVLFRVAHHVPTLDGLDERLRPLVEQALQKDPARRPTTQHLLDHLLGRERATVNAATRAVSDAWTPLLTPEEPSPSRPRSSSRWMAPAVAAALATLISTGAWLGLFRPWQQDTTATPSPTTKTATATTPKPAGTPLATGIVTPGSESAGRTFAHTDVRGVKARGHVQIDSLTWQGDKVMLRYTIRNDGGGTFISLFGLIQSGKQGTEGIELIVPDELFPVTPMFENSRCACTQWPPGAILHEGRTARAYAAFGKVPKTAKAVDVDLKDLGIFKNVVITES